MSDVFRQEYTPLDELQKAHVLAVKVEAQKLYDLFQDSVVEGERSERARCIALAKTALEEAVMWAVKGITTPPPAV